MNEVCPVCQTPIQEEDECCPRCGFKLLGATQRFDPISMDDAHDAKDSVEERKASLRVVRGAQTGVSYDLNDDKITIGRSPHCTIFLNDMTVSRTHASLVRTQGSYVISDENSFNGVWVNGRDVGKKALSSGDFIQIGSFCLIYEEN